MRSTFSGFNSARSGLFAAQRALDITGHNLANVTTRGYTRQRLEQTASTPMRLYGGQGMLGTGVDTTAIHQLRNEFLDYKYRDEASALGFWDAKADGLSFIESIMNEPSDTGIAKVIDQLFESFQELGKNANNITTRTLVRQRAITFTNSINHMYNQLEKMAVDLNFDVNSMVSSINTYGKQIAQLNDQILRSEADGSNANDLRDKRNLLIDDLSKIVDVEVLEVVNPDNPKHKQMVIKVAGKPLVYHKEFTGLKTEKVPSDFFRSFDKQIDIYEIKWADGTAFDTDNITGELKALLVMRDGEGGNEKGVPYYIKELNRFVNKFANEINEIHLKGFGLDKSTGLGFFTVDGVTTGGKTINDDIFTKINASNIRLTRHKQSMFQEGKPEDFIKSLIGTLGVEAEEADRNALNQLTLLSEIENRRQSISGVHDDEELSNMIKFQHAYNASARMITTIDEMLDVVINKIGIVGR